MIVATAPSGASSASEWWPASGIITSSAPGIAEASFSERSGAVASSSSPQITSVGVLISPSRSVTSSRSKTACAAA